MAEVDFGRSVKQLKQEKTCFHHTSEPPEQRSTERLKVNQVGVQVPHIGAEECLQRR